MTDTFLLFYRKCHFCHLLPFAKVGQIYDKPFWDGLLRNHTNNKENEYGKKKLLLDFQFGSKLQYSHHILKTSGVRLDPERVNWSQTPFRVNDDPEISQLDAEYDAELGQSFYAFCKTLHCLQSLHSTVHEGSDLKFLKETSRRFVDFPIWKYIN